MKSGLMVTGVVVALLAVAASDAGAEVVSAPSAVRPVAYREKSNDLSLSHAFMAGLPDPVAHVVLKPLDLAAVAAEDKARTQAEKTLRVGVVRALPEPVTMTSAKSGVGEWAVLDDGAQVWRLTVNAEGASGLRLHVVSASLPDGCALLVSDASDPSDTCGPYTSAGLKGRTSFWTGTVFSDCVTLECYVPAHVDPAAVAIEVDQITHIYRDPTRVAKEGSCHNDVTCFPAWAAAANGVAGIGSYSFTDYIWCTGCLVNDLDGTTWVDYFLTANHCVSNQTMADDIEFYWFFQTSSCRGGAPNLSTVTTTDGGADYLAGQSAAVGSDFAFLRLRNPSPDGATYLGWSTAAPVAQEDVACIHHPDGTYKRISFGKNTSWDTDFLAVRFSSGVTEPGSSGSPLLNAAGEIVGQLWGGGSSCANPNMLDDFGRFDVTYETIRSWLNGTSEDDQDVDIGDYLCDPQDAVLTSRGAYDGYLYDRETAGGVEATSVRGTFSLTVNRVEGALTAKAILQDRTLTFRSSSWVDVDLDGTLVAVMWTRSGDKLVLYVRQDRIWGTLRAGALSHKLYMDGARNRFSDRSDADAQAALAGFRGYYTIALPTYGAWPYETAAVTPGYGSGYLTLTVGNNGVAQFSGKLADGTAFMRSSRLIRFGDCEAWACVPLFGPLYSKKGWLGGLIWLNPENGVAVVDADLGWFIRWEKQVPTLDGFGALLLPCGGLYNSAAPLAPHYRLSAETNTVRYYASSVISAAPQLAALPAWLQVDGAGNRLVVQNGKAPAKVGVAYDYTGENCARTTLSFSSRTGIYRGAFYLYYDYTDGYGRLAHRMVRTSYAGVLTQRRAEAFDGWPEGLGAYQVTDNNPFYKPSRIYRPFWMDLYIVP